MRLQKISQLTLEIEVMSKPGQVDAGRDGKKGINKKKSNERGKDWGIFGVQKLNMQQFGLSRKLPKYI